VSSAVYPKALAAALQGNLNLTGTVKIRALDNTQLYDATDEFLADLDSGAFLGSTGTLASKTYTGGVFTAATVAIAGVSSPDVVTAYVIYIDTGSAATSRLVVYLDTAADTTLISVTGNGADISVSWPLGAIASI